MALLGKEVRVTRDRGVVLSSPWGPDLATVHPSSLLRNPDRDRHLEQRERFVADLRTASQRATEAQRGGLAYEATSSATRPARSGWAWRRL